jgi:hypothetical protein
MGSKVCCASGGGKGGEEDAVDEAAHATTSGNAGTKKRRLLWIESMAPRSGKEGEESSQAGGITLAAMRLLALCAGILAAALALYFLGRENAGEGRRSASWCP